MTGREIKFRAWVPNERKIYMRAWINDLAEVLWFDPDSDEDTILGEIKNATNCENSIINEAVIMQYTGLKDKNGKEIYENDIIKIHMPERTGERAYFNGDIGYETTTLMAAKDVFGIVRFSHITGSKLLVKKVVEHHPAHSIDDEYTKGIHVGSYIKIQKNDEVIGNIYENPELLSEETDA